MDEARVIERGFHIAKLTLLEVMPLYPFLLDRPRLSVIEVGANVGQWCEAFNSVYGHRVGTYLALEPMPGNVQLLRRRLADHLSDAPVEVIEACAGATTGSVEIHYDREVTTLASVAVSHLERPDGSVLVDNTLTRTVPQVTLDELIARTPGDGPSVDMVKIDTEGYEWDVIAGATAALDGGRIDNVYFEFGRHQAQLGQTFQQFFDFFHERGWKVYRQVVGRNYFGLNEISRVGPQIEEKLSSSMFMILASRLGPSPDYQGPRVTGRVN